MWENKDLSLSNQQQQATMDERGHLKELPRQRHLHDEAFYSMTQQG
jgi:hypothetical protein